MQLYTLEISRKAKKDIKIIKKSGDKVALNNIIELLKELKVNPRDGKGKPEKLKGYSNRYSRRITAKHRLIYEIQDEIVLVIIVAAYGHYDDH